MTPTEHGHAGSGRGGELARLIAGQMFLHACMAGTRMTAPLLALEKGYSQATVGFLLALFALTQVFLALPAGRFADRHGVKRPVAFSVAAAATGAAIAAIWPVLPVLCLSALLTGGATGAASIALQRQAGRVASGPTELRRVFSWLAIGPAVSNFVGPFAAGLLIDHGGHRVAFGAMSLFALVAWLWVRTARELPAVVAPPGEKRGTTWDLMHEPEFRRLMIVNWLVSSCWDVHTFVVPVLGHERGLSASVIGTILGAFAVASAVVRVFLPFIASRVPEWAVLASAMVAASLLFVAYPFTHGALAMGTCSVLLGIALGSVQPMVMSMLHQITPEHRHGEALGLRLMAINISSVLSPMLFGAAGTAVGVGAVFWVVGGVVGLGSRLAVRLRHAQIP